MHPTMFWLRFFNVCQQKMPLNVQWFVFIKVWNIHKLYKINNSFFFQVCKNWKKIIDSYNFWINHCKFYNYLTDAQSIQQLHKIPISALKILIAKRAFNRNLLDDDYSGDVPIKDKRWSDFGKVRRG